MAFRNAPAAAISLLLLLASLGYRADHMAAATSIREKCQCVEKTDFVHWRRITDYSVIARGPLCNNIQIILQLKNKQVCLNPDSKQGLRLQKCWRRINKDPAKLKVCLKQNGRGKAKHQ